MPDFVNFVHPRPTSWEAVLKGVREALGGDIRIVSLEDWLARLESHAEKATLADLKEIVSDNDTSCNC